MSNYHIFHTSHCGSTLLSVLLSKSLPTLTEPDWSHQIRNYDSKDEAAFFIKNRLRDNQLIKYSSVYCYMAPLLDGKKVFLYRTLTEHLRKMASKPEYLKGSLEFGISNIARFSHPQAPFSGLEDNFLLFHAYLWINRLLWIFETEDIALIDADEFLNNQQGVAKQVCDYFGVDYIPVEIYGDVKKLGFNHNNLPINVSQKIVKKQIVDPKNGIDGTPGEVFSNIEIEPATEEDILSIVNLIKSRFPKISLEFYD